MALVDYYPRLQLLASSARDTSPLGGLLDSLDFTAQAGLRVLLLDVPGQEGALLEGLSKETLSRFDAILLRGCSRALPGSGMAAEHVVEGMQTRCWHVEAVAAQIEPLWPVTVLRFDRRRNEQDLWLQRIAKLEAVAGEHELKARQFEAENMHQRSELVAQMALMERQRDELDELRRQCSEQAQSLTVLAAQEQSLRSAHAAQLQAAGQESERLRAELTAQSVLMTQQHSEIEALRRETGEQVQNLARQTSHHESLRAALEGELQAAKHELEQVQSALAEQTALAAERLQELQASHARAQALQSQMDAPAADRARAISASSLQRSAH
jgi:chromosome segregation ATPase